MHSSLRMRFAAFPGLRKSKLCVHNSRSRGATYYMSTIRTFNICELAMTQYPVTNRNTIGPATETLGRSVQP